ncbi:MAG: D-alanyl-D-alanine carboxypeptidase family protein [Clostridia bacterium]|nr:D-alanyl-D-alanine carboxypeptidase family protein [Clostridia bacterium]
MHRGNPKAMLGLIVCLILFIAAAVLLFQAVPLLNEVHLTANATPSPTPVWGNVMVVTVDPASGTPAPSLRSGQSGDAVLNLQSRLKALGYYTGELDGQFGPGTLAAVTAFQRENGLEADGIAGPETQTKLFSASARALMSTAVPAATLTPDPNRNVPYETSDGLPLLVNRSHPLADNYQPLDLVNLSKYCDSSVVRIKYDSSMAEREAVDALMVMLRAAQRDGIMIWQVSSAYRTAREQQSLLDNEIKKYMEENKLDAQNARSAALQTVAEPGTSEHQLGVCFDITVPGVSFKGTSQHNWLKEHCWDYGFILRYPEDKEKITGFLAEAWHYRWVGVAHAQRMRDEKLCLEEYIQRYGTW